MLGFTLGNPKYPKGTRGPNGLGGSELPPFKSNG